MPSHRDHPERTRDIRWIYLHMIEEHARHNATPTSSATGSTAQPVTNPHASRAPGLAFADVPGIR